MAVQPPQPLLQQLAAAARYTEQQQPHPWLLVPSDLVLRVPCELVLPLHAALPCQPLVAEHVGSGVMHCSLLRVSLLHVSLLQVSPQHPAAATV